MEHTMPKFSKNRVAARHFTWNLFVRDGIYYADGRHNTPNLGKPSLGTADREEAMRLVHQLDQRKAEEIGLARPASARDGHVKVLIADGWQRYLAHVARPGVLDGAGPKTQQRYRAVRDKHVRYCAAHGVEHWGLVDRAALKGYLTALSAEGYATNTVYTEGTVIKQVIIWMVEDEKVLPQSARIGLKLNRSEVSDTYCYKREEVFAMFELCRSTRDLQWLSDVIIALTTTGMRIGELAALRWSDVDLEHGIITLADNRYSGRAAKAGAVRTTKGRRPRRIDIHSQLRDLLVALQPRSEGGLVFRARQGGPLDGDKVLKVLKRDVIGPLEKRFPTPKGEIGFKHGGVHSFRHYFVTESFLGGATDGEVRDWVGPRDSRIVERYRHLRGSAARQTMARLNFISRGTATSVESEPARHDAGANGSMNDGREAAGPNGSEPG
jgi:integrase